MDRKRCKPTDPKCTQSQIFVDGTRTFVLRENRTNYVVPMSLQWKNNSCRLCGGERRYQPIGIIVVLSSQHVTLNGTDKHVFDNFYSLKSLTESV